MTLLESPPEGAPSDAPQNPFPGPRPLGTHDELYGRTRELRDIRGLVLSHRIVLLYAPSGAGKSSLIEAGLRRRIADKGGSVPTTIRAGRSIGADQDPGGGPPDSAAGARNAYTASVIASLEAWCGSADGLPELSGLEPSGDLSVVLSRIVEATPNERVCLFFDQFEELFTLDMADYDDKREFLSQLGDALSDRRIRAVFSMREDYIAQLDPYVNLIPTGLQTRFRLGLLGPRGAREAIQGPANIGGGPVRFEDDAADKLVQDLRTVKVERGGQQVHGLGPGVEPLQLQLVCRRLWNERLQHGRVTAADIHVGGVDQALEQYYDEQIDATVADAEAGVAEVDLRRWFDQQLITHDGYRDLVRKEGAPGNADAIVQRLETAHLIRGDSGRGPTRYELTHDRFVEPIRASNRAFETNLAEGRRKRTRNIAALVVAAVLVAAGVIVALVSANRSDRAAQLSATSIEIPSTTTVEFIDTGKQRFRLDPGVGDVVEVTLTSGTKAELTLFAVDENDNGEELGGSLANASLIPSDAREEGAEAASAVVRHTVAEERSLVVEVSASEGGTFELSVGEAEIETSDLAIGQTSPGEVAQAGAASLHRLTSDSDQVVSVTVTPTEGTGLDPVVVLLDDQGRELAYTDSNGDGDPETLSSALAAGAEYTISVTGFAGTTGSYDIAADGVQVTDIGSGVPIEGAITQAGDSEAYELSGSTDDLLQVRVDPVGGLDSKVVLLDDQGQELAFADDGSDGERETLVASLQRDGRFTIVVSGFEQSTGEFVVTVDRPEATSLPVGETRQGDVSDADDSELFRIELDGGEFAAVVVRPAAEFDAALVVETPLGPWTEDSEDGGGVERFEISNLVDELEASGASGDEISFFLGELFTEPRIVFVEGFEGSTGSFEITVEAREG